MNHPPIEQLTDMVLEDIRKRGFPYVSFDGATLRPVSETEYAGELHCSDHGTRWELGVRVTVVDDVVQWFMDSGDRDTGTIRREEN